MEFLCKPINPFQDDGLSKEDRAMIDGMREVAYVSGYRGGDVEFIVHRALKRMGRYDLLPPCERESEERRTLDEREISYTTTHTIWWPQTQDYK